MDDRAISLALLTHGLKHPLTASEWSWKMHNQRLLRSLEVVAVHSLYFHLHLVLIDMIV